MAVVLALLCIWQGHRLFAALFRWRRAITLGLLASLAAALSAGYIACYLRGGPRIIDATSYWLQARALAEGHVTWPIDEPTASSRGRFLLMTGADEAPRIGVIFPPGYPVVLALGFLARAPLAVGPLIGALIVIATYALALSVSRREEVARLAACLSVLCAALRYHTSDTMSHGWAALLFASTLAFAFASADAPSPMGRNRNAVLSGIALGWLVATRPVSGLALLPMAIVAGWEMPLRPRLLAGASALVPIAFFLVEQRLVTGDFFVSSQSAYYALSDGPPGCFRYGLGTGIGCLHEHGTYVADMLKHGLGWGTAAITTLRRLRIHLIDVVNAEPLALLALAAPFLARAAKDGETTARWRRIATLAAATVILFLAYFPFYFDGSYPGGGARFFADALPVEHVLIAAAVAMLVDRFAMPRAMFGRAAAAVSAIALAGFGVHASYEHLRLRDREGGRPFFEPAVLAYAKVDHGLVFTRTDHAFNLAYDPDSLDATRKVVVARESGDDRDRQTWERLGRPPSYRYVFDGRDARPEVVPWTAPPASDHLVLEAESEWPPLRQSGGFFEPIFAQGTCASGGRVLAIRRTTDRFEGAISFSVPVEGRYRISIRLVSRGDVHGEITVRDRAGAPPLATWKLANPRRDDCFNLPEQLVFLSGRARLEVTADAQSEWALDAVTLERAPPAEAVR
jgi:hypothetical protein